MNYLNMNNLIPGQITYITDKVNNEKHLAFILKNKLLRVYELTRDLEPGPEKLLTDIFV